MSVFGVEQSKSGQTPVSPLSATISASISTRLTKPLRSPLTMHLGSRRKTAPSSAWTRKPSPSHRTRSAHSNSSSVRQMLSRRVMELESEFCVVSQSDSYPRPVIHCTMLFLSQYSARYLALILVCPNNTICIFFSFPPSTRSRRGIQAPPSSRHQPSCGL